MRDSRCWIGFSRARALPSSIEYQVSSIFSILGQVMTSLQVFYEGTVKGVDFRCPDATVPKALNETGGALTFPVAPGDFRLPEKKTEWGLFLDRFAKGNLHSRI